MSTNPFLKQKTTNNRFNSLISDQPVSSFKNTFLSKKTDITTTNNTTTNNTTVKNTTTNNTTVKNTSTNNTSTNNTSTNNTSTNKPTVSKNKKGVIFEEEFPLLCETHDSLMTDENAFKFTDAVNTVIAEEIKEEAKVLPKWVSYSIQNGTTVVYHGSYVLEKLRLENEKQLLENTPNTLMKTVTDKLQKKWEKFRVDYDLIHGDGSYNQEYILPPIYGPEYELEDEDYYEDNSSSEYIDTNEYLDEYIE